MKALTLTLISLILFTVCSCKKPDDVSPDVAAEVTGTYQVQYAYGNGQTLKLPTANANAGITFTRISNSEISLVFAYNGPVGSYKTRPYPYEVKRIGSTYEIRTNNRKTGTVEENTLKMDVVNDDGSSTYVEAVRR